MHERRAPILALLLAAALPAGARGAEAPAGDSRHGEALFTGTARFENGGAPCLACHGVAGHGLARAASFGPDLTAVYATYGAEALDAALADIPFPSMAPLYAKHVVTPAERADVTAFLHEAANGTPPAIGAGFALGVAGIAAFFLAVSVALGRGRARAPRSLRRETP